MRGDNMLHKEPVALQETTIPVVVLQLRILNFNLKFTEIKESVWRRQKLCLFINRHYTLNYKHCSGCGV